MEKDRELNADDFEACCDGQVDEETIIRDPIWGGMPRGHRTIERNYTCVECGKVLKRIKPKCATCGGTGFTKTKKCRWDEKKGGITEGEIITCPNCE